MDIITLAIILKPHKYISQNTLAASFMAEAEEAKANGEPDYEIGARFTRSGNPYVIRF